MQVSAHFAQRYRERVDADATDAQIEAAATEAWDKKRKADLWKPKWNRYPGCRYYTSSNPSLIFIFTRVDDDDVVAKTILVYDNAAREAHRARR